MASSNEISRNEDSIIKVPLKWEDLKSKPETERKSMISKRVKAFLQLYSDFPEISEESAKVIDTKRKENRKNADAQPVDSNQKIQVLWDPRVKIQQMYPAAPEKIQQLQEDEKSRWISELCSQRKCWVDKISKHASMHTCRREESEDTYELIEGNAVFRSKERLKDDLDRFRGSKLFSNLSVLLKDNLKLLGGMNPINKIVAFGGGTLNPGIPDDHVRYPFGGKQRTQHAMLLAVRTILGTEDEIKIYLQDPNYLDIDEATAQFCEMEVLKSDNDKQEGWQYLDGSTFIFDLGTTFPIHQLIWEISRPAVIFSFAPITEECFVPNVAFPATLEENNKSFIIPGVGLSDYTFKNFTDDYLKLEMDVSNLDCGSMDSKHEEFSKHCRDGYRGQTYIGKQPTLYIRRPVVELQTGEFD